MDIRLWYIPDIGSSTHTRSFALYIFPANENNRLHKTLNHFLGGNLGPLRMFALLLTFHFTFERLDVDCPVRYQFILGKTNGLGIFIPIFRCEEPVEQKRGRKCRVLP